MPGSIRPLRRGGLLVAVPVLLALAAVLSPSPGFAQGAATAARLPTLPPELAGVRASLDKYRDPIVAVHDGYLSSVACVAFREGGEGHMHYPAGGMGVHFLNFRYVGQALDPARPQVLIYEQAGDQLRLAAAEWFVPAGAAGEKAPTIFGQLFQGPMEGHEPFQPKGLHHWDLHVWLWRENPAGMFAPTNPAISCPKGAYAFKGDAPKPVARGGQ